MREVLFFFTKEQGMKISVCFVSEICVQSWILQFKDF